MGKGDIKSRRGKIINKSYGVRRRKNSKTVIPGAEVAAAAVKEEEPKVTKPAKPRATKKKAE